MSKEIYLKPRTLANSLCNLLQSLPLRVLAIGAVYATGYFKLNPVWIMVAWGFLKYRDMKKIEKMFKREAAMSVALRDDRKMVVANVHPTPPWVYFPDFERCEWLNKIISHLWPTIPPYLMEYAKLIFEPSINEALATYKKNLNFSFEDRRLGTVSPRISGIKVYNKGSGDQIMIDINIYFSSDSVLSFALNNAKGGIESFKIKCCLRTIILPVTTSDIQDLIGGVEFFFVHQPKIEFDLTGILYIFDIPVLKTILRNTIDSKISQTLVLPHKTLIKISDHADLESLMFPDPVGFLRINVIEATALEERDKKNPDANVTITFASKSLSSETVENSRNPVWNFWAGFIINSFWDDTITITVDNRKGNKLGTLSIDLQFLEDIKTFDSWIQLEGVATGMIHARAWYYHLEINPEVLTQDNTLVLLVVFLKNAINLVSKSKVRNSVAILYVGEDTRMSRPVPIENAVYEEVFTFLVKDPSKEKLRVKLIEQGSTTILGETDFEIKDLLTANNMELMDQQLKLDGRGETSALSLSLRLRGLKAA